MDGWMDDEIECKVRRETWRKIRIYRSARSARTRIRGADQGTKEKLSRSSTQNFILCAGRLKRAITRNLVVAKVRISSAAANIFAQGRCVARSAVVGPTSF